MKKCTWLISVFLLLFFAGTVFAEEQWYKTSHNPLSITEPAGYVSLFQSHIFYYNGLFRGIFSAKSANGKYNLIYADSTNAQIWENSREILAIDKDIGTPRIFIDGTTIRLFYSKKDGDSYAIYSVSCDTDFNCNNNEHLELSTTPNGWDADDVASPFIIKEGETYWLLYSGWKNDGWKIGAAYSSDAYNWTRCPNNPVIPYGDGPFIQKSNNQRMLYYHKPDASGIFKTQTSGPLMCDSHWSDSTQIVAKDKPYDINHIITPSVIEWGGHIYIFYSGLDTENQWHLIETSDTPQKTTFAVVLPGFGASWNKEALLHGHTVTSQEWTLAPFVHEYDGLLETLKSLHFKEGSDYILFPYDWRKHVGESADELYTTLKNTILIKDPGTKIVLIGHSLGGLVGRSFSEKHPDLVDRLITVGTPHGGVVQVYSALEGGDIQNDNDLLWLGQHILLALEKKGFETDKQTLSRTLPVLFDLFPTYNFLLNQNGTAIDYSSLSIKSSLVSLTTTSKKTYSIYGLSKLTPTLLRTQPPSQLHKLLNNFTDGEPTEVISQNGDGTVPVVSAQMSSVESIGLPLDHGQLVYTKQGIQRILQFMPPQLFAESALSEGAQTIVTPSILFMVQSPISLSVNHNDTTYKEQDGIIFIPNAPAGSYTLTATGKAHGKYTIHIGQSAQENTVWEKITGEITKNPPETYTYSLEFDPKHTSAIFPSPNPTPQQQTEIAQAKVDNPTPTTKVVETNQHKNTSVLPISTATEIISPKAKKSNAVLGITNRLKKQKRPKYSKLFFYILCGLLLAVCILVISKRKKITYFIRTLLQEYDLLQ